MFDTVAAMRYEIDVLVNRPLDEQTARFLEAVVASANQVVRFRGDDRSIRLTVNVAGLNRDDAIRSAASEVARIFPGHRDEHYLDVRGE